MRRASSICSVALGRGSLAQFGDDVAVGVKRHGRRVTELGGEVDDRYAPIVEEEAGEGVPEVVRPRVRQPGGVRRRLEPARAPVAVVVVAARPDVRGAGEEERVVAWPPLASRRRRDRA